jgi:hypothetical protein
MTQYLWSLPTNTDGKWTPGEWHETHGEIECDQCGEQAYLCDVTSHAEDDTPYLSLAMQFVGLESLARPNADFVCAAANARPALETLAGCVVLSVEDAKAVMRLLDSLATFAAINGRCGSMPDACASMRMSASIAEAEEAMR